MVHAMGTDGLFTVECSCVDSTNMLSLSLNHSSSPGEQIVSRSVSRPPSRPPGTRPKCKSP